MLKKYLKDESFDPIYNPLNRSFVVRSRIGPLLIFVLAFIVLAWQVIIPLVFFKTRNEISQPVSSTILGLVSGFSPFTFEELIISRPQYTTNETTPRFFYLTIPKLSIKKALVEINAPSLSPDNALGHYTGSALPGTMGNTFIYGHSVLPWFYNPRNYKTIFSTLGELTTGDIVEINYQDIIYTYIVESKITLKPENVNPIAEFKPKYLNESTLTLMTCDPPGTKINRLLIRAVLHTS